MLHVFQEAAPADDAPLKRSVREMLPEAEVVEGNPGALLLRSVGRALLGPSPRELAELLGRPEAASDEDPGEGRERPPP